MSDSYIEEAYSEEDEETFYFNSESDTEEKKPTAFPEGVTHHFFSCMDLNRVTIPIEHGLEKMSAKAWGLDEGPICVKMEYVTGSETCNFVYVGSSLEEKEHIQTKNILEKMNGFIRNEWVFGEITPADQVTLYELNIPKWFYCMHKGDLEGTVTSWLEYRQYGIVGLIRPYVLSRLKSYNRYCILCDQECYVGLNMVKPFVCNNILCIFQNQIFKMGSISGEFISYILFYMAYDAVKSGSHELIFTPYPTIAESSDKFILHPDEKDIEEVRKIFEAFPLDVDFYNAPLDVSMRLLAKEHEHAGLLYQWILDSNRATIVSLPDGIKVPDMGECLQFILLMDSPEKQVRFDTLKEKHGTIFGFHGSASHNWHSIMRNGLKNASGTKLQRNGASYGNGIYIAKTASMSYGYSNKGGSFICMALCEIINDESDIKRHGDIMVIPNEDYVTTRFLFLYDIKNKELPDLCIRDKADNMRIHKLMEHISNL